MLRLRELQKDFDGISIMYDVGINENTIVLLAQKIKQVNSKIPAPHTYDEDKLCEKFLECIFTTSKHFSEGAQIEYNAPVGQRQFERAAVIGPPAVPASRDFRVCELHYAPLWRQAVRSRLPGFGKREPSARPVVPAAQTMEQGARAADAAFAGFAHRHAGGCCGGAAGQMQGEPAEHDSGHALLARGA